MKAIKENRIRIELITIQSIFLAFLLLVEWTKLQNEVHMFFSLLNLNDWAKILFVVPLIFMLQIFALRAQEYYLFGIPLYGLILVLEVITSFIIFTNGEMDVLNAVAKVFELTILGATIFLLLKLNVKKQKKSKTANT
jgi:CDP-diglyceride synthetase